jgi:hypothetical protein
MPLVGYYIRLLSPSEIIPDLAALRASLAAKPGISVALVASDDGQWSQVVVSDYDETAITSIERNVVQPGLLGAKEIEEFLSSIQTCRPASAVAWLAEYLPTVKNIYAFQILSGARRSEEGWNVVHTVQGAIRDAAGGIMQADLEGFSNEEGFHILWQFRENVRGPRDMAVLRDGDWINFRMELSDCEQREAFFRGEVPDD